MPAIPLVNLSRQYAELKEPVARAMQEVLDRQNFIQGPCVVQFEKEFAAFTRATHAIGCSNGTSALSLALEAVGVKAGDEVITVAHTFIATVEAICRVGATPVFVDIDPDTYAMAADQIEKKITPKTRAILPVHIYGTMCDMDRIMAIAKKHKLAVVEDAAQAHGATWGGKPAGSFGDAGCFSFYPGKNLGAYGDAGAIVTSRDDVAATARSLRDHGRRAKYEHTLMGYNERMDELQAAVLNVKLKHLAAWNAHRKEIADLYRARLKDFRCMEIPSAASSAYHLFVTEVGNRDEVLAHLHKQEIGAGIHYPIPAHRQPVLKDAMRGVSLPITEKAAGRIVSLPICGHITQEEAGRVADEFLKAAKP